MQVLNPQTEYLFADDAVANTSGDLIWAEPYNYTKLFNPAPSQSVFSAQRDIFAVSNEELLNVQPLSWENYLKSLTEVKIYNNTSVLSLYDEKASVYSTSLADVYRTTACIENLLFAKMPNLFTANTSTKPLQLNYVFETAPKFNLYIVGFLRGGWGWITRAFKQIKSTFKTALDWVNQFAELFYIARIPRVLLA